MRNLSLVVVASLEPALPDVLGVRWSTQADVCRAPGCDSLT